MTDMHTQLAEVHSLKEFNAALLRKWMEAAAHCMNPQRVSGKDFNRTGELLLNAAQQIEVERKRLAEAIRLAEYRKSREMLTPRS